MKECPVGNVGDVIDHVRIIGVNRKKKQIAVTLRTDRALSSSIDDSREVAKVDTNTTLGKSKSKESSTTSPLRQPLPTPTDWKNENSTNHVNTVLES